MITGIRIIQGRVRDLMKGRVMMSVCTNAMRISTAHDMESLILHSTMVVFVINGTWDLSIAVRTSDHRGMGTAGFGLSRAAMETVNGIMDREA